MCCFQSYSTELEFSAIRPLLGYILRQLFTFTAIRYPSGAFRNNAVNSN